MSRYPRLLLLAMTTTVVGVIIFTAGCGTNDRSRLRVVHASPDAPNVDVLLDGKTLLPNVAYETASSYLTVSAGSRKIEVRATGTSQDVINAKVNLSRNKDYTVLAVDKVASISPLVLTDDNTPPVSGQVKLRLVHASPTPALLISTSKHPAQVSTVSAQRSATFHSKLHPATWLCRLGATRCM